MIYIIFALILDFIFADPYNYPHPVKFMGKYISFFEKIIFKRFKTPYSLRIWGGIMGLSLIIISYLSVYFVLKAAFSVNFYFGAVLNIIFMWNCIALKCLDKEVTKVYNAFLENDIEKARKAVSYLVSRDTQSLDKEGIIKAAVETAVENTSDGVTAPLFYMILGGAPLAMAYKAVNTLDSMIGYKNEKYIDFGKFCAYMDDAANFIPARLTGIAIVIFSALCGFNYKRSFKTMVRDSRKSKSLNAGYPEAAAAGALGIQIGGVSNYFGKEVFKETIGDKIKDIEIMDIKDSIKIMYGAAAVFIAVGYFLRWCIV